MSDNSKKPAMRQLTDEEIAEKFSENGEFQHELMAKSIKSSLLSSAQNFCGAVAKIFVYFIQMAIVARQVKILMEKEAENSKRIANLEKNMQNDSRQVTK